MRKGKRGGRRDIACSVTTPALKGALQCLSGYDAARAEGGEEKKRKEEEGGRGTNGRFSL